MLNSMKYSIIRALRDKEFMLSTILITLVIGTVLNFTTNTMLEEITAGTLEIPVAIVQIEGSDTSTFIQTLEAAQIFELEFVDMAIAIDKLENNDVAGIFEVGVKPRLLVVTANARQLVLHAIADEYVINAAVLQNIANENPASLENVVANLLKQTPIASEMELANNLTSPMQHLAIAFITLVAVSGLFVGFERAMMTTNDGATASRRITSSLQRVKILIADLVGVALVVVVLTFGVWAYFFWVLGVDLEMNLILAALAFFLVALLSVSVGACFGLVIPGTKKLREQVLMVIYLVMLVPVFFVGQLQLPAIVDSLNPMALIQDTLMALKMQNYARYFGFITTMIVIVIMLLSLTIISLRRVHYVDTK